MAALLDGLVMALRNWSTTPTPQGHRMADFARLSAAAAPAFNWTPKQVVELLRDNATTQAQRIAEGDVVAMAVTAVLEDSRSYGGTMGALYETAKTKVDDETRRSPAWPKTPRYFGDGLRRAVPALRAIGVRVLIRSKDGRTHVDMDRREASPLCPLQATLATSDQVGEVGEWPESGRHPLCLHLGANEREGEGGVAEMQEWRAMSAAALLMELQGVGASVRAEGDDLVVRAPGGAGVPSLLLGGATGGKPGVCRDFRVWAGG